MTKIVRILGLLMLLVPSAFISSCSDDGPKEPEQPAGSGRVILIYAVAANNLQPNLTYDMNEILRVAPQLDLKNNSLLIYSVVNSGVCKLQKLQKNAEGRFEFADIEIFPELPLSTSKERIEEVIDYVNEKFDYPRKGLILWSHATGWVPWFAGSNPSLEKRKAFGHDNFEGATYKTNITELAEAIPNDIFDFIWFDCCYMANIETIYQLREKSPFIIGSVLEIHEDGMPYDLTMPYLLQYNADLQGAAYQFFKYYDQDGIAVSISITKTENLPMLADASAKIFTTGSQPTYLGDVQNYARQGYKFYDMEQLLDAYSNIEEEDKFNLKEALEETVIYKLISGRDFNRQEINVADYSGLSMHNYLDNGSSDNLFYETLDWYKATRPSQFTQ